MKKEISGILLSCALIFSHTLNGEKYYYSPCDSSYYIKQGDTMVKVVK